MNQVNDNKLKKQLGIGLLLATYVGVLAYLSNYIA
ncbi:hypothetical protein VISP3789_11974 [Vibrio splendidus ATCC 33789]|jgi:hypothetical protein|nr:hypothetical protein VSWAT3_21460 [Vibrionales bacterium SWAT-3]EGU43748.1 hypothetical protein VISP3789_11974 [Vibrio splendidus ATCC 33789]